MGKGLRRKRGEINDLNRELGGERSWGGKAEDLGAKALGGKGEK